MSTQILMPALSPTMTEGKLSRWLKNVGDDVRAGTCLRHGFSPCTLARDTLC